MSFFSDLFGGKKAKVITTTIADEAKKSIASPLSSYLSSEIGKGLPSYTGKLYDTYEAPSNVSDFLSMNTNEFFSKYVEDPTMKNWEKNILPTITEQYAGNLSSSGRYSAQSASASDISASLASQRASLAQSLPQAQYTLSAGIKAMNDADYKLDYQNWYSSLPETNPVLQSALSFLSESTNTGTTILSGLQQGQAGILGDLIKAAAAAAAANCYSATAIFGDWYHPKTCEFRYYIYNIAPKWMRNFYHKNSLKYAYSITTRKWIKTILTPIFEIISYLGRRNLYGKRN